MSEEFTVTALDRWGRRPLFLVKIGTFSGTLALIRGAATQDTFSIDQRVQYAEWSELQGMSKGMTPKWQHGYIWKVEDNRVFINRV